LEKIKIRCLGDAERFFSCQPEENYKEFCEDMDACFSWDWETFCQRINSLKKSYLSKVEFVY
jgi:hypothetical protein